MFTRTALALVFALLVALPAAAQDYKRGQVAYHRGDFTNALREWWLLAEQGNARSQYSVGVLYERGQGVPQNYAEAAMWYRKAAEQGYSSAQYNLAQMFRRGLGVPQDYAKAVKWFRKAAEQGNAEAQKSLRELETKRQAKTRQAAPSQAEVVHRVLNARDPQRLNDAGYLGFADKSSEGPSDRSTCRSFGGQPVLDKHYAVVMRMGRRDAKRTNVIYHGGHQYVTFRIDSPNIWSRKNTKIALCHFAG